MDKFTRLVRAASRERETTTLRVWLGECHPRIELQPDGSSQCGQACVAMLASATVEEVCSRFRHYIETRPAQIARMLRAYGFDCPDKPLKGHPTVSTAIVHLKWPRVRMGHWVLMHRSQVYCPTYGMNPKCFGAARSTLHLPIWRYHEPHHGNHRPK